MYKKSSFLFNEKNFRDIALVETNLELNMTTFLKGLYPVA